MKQLNTNKKLYAAMAGMLLTMSTAVQADITLYGKARTSVDLTDNGVDNVTNVSSNSSRLGFKGSEDLGNGLKAVFQYETLIFLDDGAGSTGTLFGTARNSYVGIVSGLGTLLLGVTDNPYKLATNKLDVYSDSMGDFNTIMGNVSGASTPFDEREPNSINYWSPKFNGLQLMGAYRPDESGAVKRDRYSLSVVYENGPLYGSIAYENHKSEANAAGSISSTATGRIFDTQGWKAGIGYAFNHEKTKLGLVYESLSQDGAATVLDRDAWYLSLAHKMDNNTFKLAYAKANDNDKGDDTGANWYVVGLDHSLSKRTTIYALYAKTNNDSAARYGLGTGGSTGAVVPALGDDPSTFSIGINHDF